MAEPQKPRCKSPKRGPAYASGDPSCHIRSCTDGAASESQASYRPRAREPWPFPWYGMDAYTLVRLLFFWLRLRASPDDVYASFQGSSFRRTARGQYPTSEVPSHLHPFRSYFLCPGRAACVLPQVAVPVRWDQYASFNTCRAAAMA